jgi:hypothetical protein
MGIICAKKITCEHKNYSNWWDYPRREKDLLISGIEKGSLSLILWD